MLNRVLRGLSLIVALASFGVAASANPVILSAQPAGDCQYAYNTKYGPYGYSAGASSLGVGLYFGAPYGNDFTIGIFEIPIAPLAGQTLTSATLEVNSLGFGTNYYYGSANLGWMDTGTRTLTGDPVADALGPIAGTTVGWQIYNSDSPAGAVSDGLAGMKSFDILTCLQDDIDAGRSYSTFVMIGSRDTWGGIASAESGGGARIIANVVAAPEPGSLAVLALGGLSLLARRRKA